MSDGSNRQLDHPLVVWDGDCRFCLWSVVLLRNLVGDRVDDLPYQTVHREFPEVGRKEFAEHVYLFEPDGTPSNGAEAIYRALTYSDYRLLHLGDWLYRHLRWFARASEWAYDWVSRHRPQLTAVFRPLIEGPTDG